MSSLLALALLVSAQDGKRAVPAAADLERAQKVVKEVFKDEYGRTDAPSRKALAQKLLKQAGETQDDLAARYVLFREARDLAAAAGETSTALQAIEELHQTFEGDPLRMRLAAMTTIIQEARAADGLKAATEALLKLADEAGSAEEFDTAEKAAASAAAGARKAKDVSLTARADAKSRELAGLKARQAKVKAARAALAANPADPAAQFEVGHFECFVKGHWDSGLPHLARGSNEGIKSVALKDLAAPAQPAEQASLGDAWWDRAEQEKGVVRQRMRERAAAWYAKASEGLSGLSKVKVEKRLRELGPVASGRDGVSPQGLAGWWKMDEGSGTVVQDSSTRQNHGKLVGSAGWADGRLGKGVRLLGRGDSVSVPDSESLRITGDLSISLWVLKEQLSGDWARLVGKGASNDRNYNFWSGGANQQHRLLFQQWEGPLKPVVELETAAGVEKDVWTHLAAVVKGDRVAIYVNGRPAAEGKRTGKAIASTEPLLFGYAGFHQSFTGVLDDVRIYARALDDAELRILSSTK